jgi:hypothetical protein
MEIQDILAFLTKESVKRDAENAKRDAEIALLRKQLSEQFLAMKSAHAYKKEGSAAKKLQDWRRMEEAKLKETQ